MPTAIFAERAGVSEVLAVIENQIVTVIAQTSASIADNPFDGVKVIKFRVAVLLDLDIAAAQKLLQRGFYNASLRPIKDAIIVVAGEVNHFRRRYENPVMIIKSVHAANSDMVCALWIFARPNFRRLKVERQRIGDNVHDLRKSLRMRKISALNSFSRFWTASL